MLDAVVDFLPCPLDIPRHRGPRGRRRDGSSSASADENEPFAALAFKIMTDPHLGKLTYIRVYSGTLTSGTAVINATKDRRSGSAGSTRCTPTSARTSPRVGAGDIVAVRA